MFRSRRSIGALLAAVVLAGCATVPTSGPVERHTPQATGVNSGVHVDPLPPADGASQLLVVEGFLHAMSVYQPNYAVARQYLTESANRAWHPESGVQVYADGFPPTEYDQTVILQAPLTGTVDASGSYKPGPGSGQSHNFVLSRDQNNQWRISNPPQGLLVSRYVFTTNFTAINLYFLDPTGTALVPDPRFFATGDQALTGAVTQLVAGPSAWLTPAVRKLDTSGITVGGVTVDANGTADVALGGAVERLSAEQRHGLLAEITYTLAGFDQVSAVRVTGAGQVWRDDVGQTVVRPENFIQLAPEGAANRVLFLLHEHRLVRLRDTTTNWNDFGVVEAGLTRPEQIAVSSDLAQVAATTDGGTRLELGLSGSTKAAKVVRTGSGLLRPAFARNGELWSPASGDLSELQVFKADQRLKVTLTGLPKQRVQALALSGDGTRVAFILRHGKADVVGLARVERTENAITIVGWRTVDLALNTGNAASFLDLGWISPTELGVLVSSGGDTSVVRASQDGATASDIGPGEASALGQLAVAPAPGSPAVALGASGNLYRFDGEFNWNLAITLVEAVAYSG
jgi:hypothetical protein